MSSRNKIIHGVVLAILIGVVLMQPAVAQPTAAAEYVENGALVTEDVKGVLTPEFKLKSKLMKAVHGIEIRLT